MKTKRIKVCEAIEIDFRVHYPYSHSQRHTVGYVFVVNPDYADRLMRFVNECVVLHGGKCSHGGKIVREDYPVKDLKDCWEIRDSIFGEESEEWLDRVSAIWNSINK